MQTNDNYGLILQHLRQLNGLSVRNMAKKIGRSIGWISEIENGCGTARLTEAEFNRIVELLDGTKHREMFRTWVANRKNSERTDKTFDGAVLKYIRLKKELRLKEAASLTGLSVGYLSCIENGYKPTTLELRKQIMSAYGYNPSSFKNLSTDPVRSKAVPASYKLQILLNKLCEGQIEKSFEYIRELFESTPISVDSIEMKS